MSTLAQYLHRKTLVDRRLYGMDGDEELYWDEASWYESRIEPDLEEDDRPEKITFFEYDVHLPESHLPPMDRVFEFIEEWTADMGEVDEGFSNDLAKAMKQSLVADSFKHFYQTIAQFVGYGMAKDRVASHELTWVDGEPHVDGKPMYVKREEP